MADISRIARVISGATRNVDISLNTLVTTSVKIGGPVTNTELTKALLDNLVLLTNGSDADGLHNHNAAYYTKATIDTALSGKVATSTTVNGHALSSNVTVSKADVGLGNVADALQVLASDLDTDVNLAADSNSKVATQHAVKAYVDSHSGTAADAIDSTFVIKNSVDPTKKIAFSAASIANLATRTITMPDANVNLGALTNSNIGAAAAIAYSKLSLSGSIVNSDVNASAAIALSKLAALTASRALVSDGSGVVSASAVLASELAFLSGATSNIQSQLGALASSTDVIRKDGTVAFTANQSMGSFKLTSLADGTSAADAVNKGQLDNGLALKVAKAGDTMSGNLNMGGFKVTGAAAGTSANDYVTKAQLDAQAAGLVWLNPVEAINLIDDSLNTPPGSPVEGDIYIAGASPTGAWATFAGHAFQWQSSAWVDISAGPVLSGDRYGVSFNSATAGAGGLAGKDNQVATIVSATPGAITYTFQTPIDGNALFIHNPSVIYSGQQWTYIGASTSWAQFGGTSAIVDGIGLAYSGNVLNIKLGAGIAELPSDEVGVDVHSAGGLMTSIDNSASSGATGAQLAIKLDGSTLSKSSSGLKVATGGISNSEVNAAAAIAYSKLNLGSSIVNADVAAGAAIAESKLALAFGTSALNTAIGNHVANTSNPHSVTKSQILTGNLIVNADVDAAAAIAYSKLALSASIVNGDIATGAAIAYSKLALSASIVNADVASGAAIAYSKLALSASVVNADISASAAIVYSKLSLANSIVAADLVTDAVTTIKIAAAAVDENKIASSALDSATMSGGSGSKLAVAAAPKIKETMVAGETFAANTSFLVRMAMSGETAGRFYKADKDASAFDKFYVIGVVMSTSALSAGDSAVVLKFGPADQGSNDVAFSSADIGMPLFLGTAGAIIKASSLSNAAGEAAFRIGVIRTVGSFEVQSGQLNGIA